MVIATELEKIYEKMDNKKINACQLYEEASSDCPHFHPYEEACAFDAIERKMERVLSSVDPHRKYRHEEN